MRRRGITLVELLLALAISALVMMAASDAYIVGSRTAKTLGDGRDVVARRAAFESALTDLFEHVYLDADTTDLNTYFISGDNLASKSISSTGTTSGSGSASSSGDSSSLGFTVLGRRLGSDVLSSSNNGASGSSTSDTDFTANNDAYGPVGGVGEIELGTSAVGQPTGSPNGLFLRQQYPSDSDPTQGGRESLLSDEVDTISFEFYDGTDWQTSWDTTTMSPRRLPSAVRVTYRLTGDTEDRIQTFAIPGSDVTPDNPVTTTTGTTS